MNNSPHRQPAGRFVLGGAALCAAGAALTFTPGLLAQQSDRPNNPMGQQFDGNLRAQADTGDKNKSIELTDDQRQKVQEQMREMRDELSGDSDQIKETADELARLICKAEIAKQLLNDPQLKGAITQSMAGREGQQLKTQVKEAMSEHRDDLDQFFSDGDQVRDLVLMTKAMAIGKEMGWDKQGQPGYQDRAPATTRGDTRPNNQPAY